MSAWLIVGDTLTLAALTLIGFATHGENGLALLPRMAATFFPLLMGWFLAAPALGAYDAARAADFRALWRPLLAMILAGPLAVLLRALWLNGVVIPIFGLVLTGSGLLAMALWRGIWLLLARKINQKAG
ncbi:MAG: hypothetical protein OHK0031_01580 [Anaerolineales bacterium]